MKKKPKQPTRCRGVQVFDLTMDNTEDQEELNRRLRKPGESESIDSPKKGNPDYAKPTREADRG